MSQRPLFSICHTTARPEGWQQSFGAWCGRETGQSRAEYLGGLEYILCIDRRWGFTTGMVQEFKAFAASQYPNVDFKVVWNNGRKCMVDGYAFAAAASTGSILILNSDDMFPPKDWDRDLEMQSCCGPRNHGHVADFVIQVSSGIEAHDSMGLMTLQIMSRALYERWGYALYPGYESMRADDDFSEHARHDGVVIDARHLLFEHRQPIWSGKGQIDQVYEHENKPSAYTNGLRLLNARRANGFTETTQPKPRVIAVCTPGRDFSMQWKHSWQELEASMLANGIGFCNFDGYSNNIYMTRLILLRDVFSHLEQFDYLLWIDSDNLVSWECLQHLLRDLDEYPDVSMVAGWYYLQAEGNGETEPEIKASAGRWINQEFCALPISELEAAHTLLEVDCTGFGCVLMRADTARLAGPDAFIARVSQDYQWGMTGDDISFCLTLKERGGKILVDPRLRVEHLKRQPIRPSFNPTATSPETGQSEEKGSNTWQER
jgi:hypothetical protein